MDQRSVWRHRDLRLGIVCRSVSFLGDEIATIALALYAYDAGWGTAGVAAIFVAACLPFALGAPLVGRYVDRVDSRRITAGAAAVQAAAAVAAAAVLWVGRPGSPWTVAAVLGLVLVLMTAQAASNPAWSALTPHIVPADEVPRAVSASQATGALAAVAGPALGGLLVAHGGAQTALLVDGLTFLVLVAGALAVRTVRRPEPGAGGDSPWAGLALIRDDRLFAALLGGILAILLVIQVMVVVEVFFVRSVFGAGPATYGLVGLVFAVMNLVGAMLAGRLGTVVAQAWGIVGSLVGISVCAVAGGLAPSLVWLTVVLGLVGVANGLLNVAVGAFAVARSTDAVRGRVFAAVAGTTQLATVVGLGAAAVLGDVLDPRRAYVVTGLVGTTVSVVVVVVVLRALRAGAAVEPVPVGQGG